MASFPQVKEREAVYRLTSSFHLQVSLGLVIARRYKGRNHPRSAFMQSPDTNTDVVELLLARVRADTRLDARVRARAESLMSLTQRAPSLAEASLRELHRSTVATLPLRAATTDMCRCVSAENFFLFHLRDEARGLFRDSRDFLAYIAGLSDPSQELRRLLSPLDPLFRRDHTWMAPCSSLAGLDGKALRRALALRGSAPPYVVFVMSLERLAGEHVSVRRSTALDAVPAGLTYWNPDGLPTGIEEFVDADIPIAALEDIEWRP